MTSALMSRLNSLILNQRDQFQREVKVIKCQWMRKNLAIKTMYIFFVLIWFKCEANKVKLSGRRFNFSNYFAFLACVCC